jgi:hypothetical protein
VDAPRAPKCRVRLVLVVALFALAALGGCGNNHPDGTSSEQSSDEEYTQVGCAIAAKTLELIASRLREGNTAREIIDQYGGGLDKSCEIVIKAWVNQPDRAQDITLTGTGGDSLDRPVSGGDLTQLAPKAPGTNQRSCLNWRTEFLRTLCQQQALQEVRRIIEEQQHGQ